MTNASLPACFKSRARDASSPGAICSPAVTVPSAKGFSLSAVDTLGQGQAVRFVQLAGQCEREGGHPRGRHLQPVIGVCAGQAHHAFRDPEPADVVRRLVEDAPRGIVANEHGGSRVRAQHIRLQGEDHPGAIEPVLWHDRRQEQRARRGKLRL